jgi:hypothetical protein
MIRWVLEQLIRAGEAADAPAAAAKRRKFETLGDVLQDAEVQVHSVTPAAAPPEEPEAEVDDPDSTPEREGPLTWYRVELTLSPAGEGPWEPVGFILTGPEARSGAAGTAAEANQDWGEIDEILVWNGQAWQDAGMEEYSGAQRLRLLLGVPAGVSRVRFRYHFTAFGDLYLPPPPHA